MSLTLYAAIVQVIDAVTFTAFLTFFFSIFWTQKQGALGEVLSALHFKANL